MKRVAGALLAVVCLGAIALTTAPAAAAVGQEKVRLGSLSPTQAERVGFLLEGL